MKSKRVLCSLLSVVLILAMLVQFVPVSAFAENSVVYGDVNSDGVVNNDDVELLARYLSDDKTATINAAAADVDRNSTVDLNDLLYLVKVIQGVDVSLGESVTITFETNGGEAIEPITVVTGGAITIPEAKKDGAVFLGWYTDAALETPFYGSDPITEDLTVYAKYQEVSGQPEYTPAFFALQDQSANLTFTVVRVSGQLNPDEAVTLSSADGSVAPGLSFTPAGENKWVVAADGGYIEGASYIMTLADGYNFEGKDVSIREVSFFIAKEEVANLTINEDIIYIRDTAEMVYTLSDGTSSDVLDANVLYNSDDVITGSFSYTGEKALQAGDTVCIYVTTNPTERDYINGNYENDPTAYIVVESVNGSTVSFRGMSMQGENSDVEKLISLPNTIPFSVLNLPEGDGTVDFNDRDVAALIAMYNTGAPEEAKVGDFLVFYVGNFGSLREDDTVYYKKVTAVEGSTITYVESSQEELLGAVDLFLEQDIDGDKMLENVDQGQLEAQVMQQVESTNFAEDAAKYLGDVIACSDDFYDYVAQNKLVVYDEDGVELTEEEIKAYGLGNSFELADDVELSFNITTCDGENSHFDEGVKLTLMIGAEFEVDVGKDAKKGKLKIELSAAFTQEVFLDVSINANADITWILFVPKINDIVFSSAVDVMSYTGVSVEAKFYTMEPEEDFFDKLKENWGDSLGEDAMKKIESFKKDYEEKFDEGSLAEDIEGFWESQTALIEDLITNGEITEEQAEACMEARSENHIVETLFSKAHIMDDEEYNAGITELAERYADMLGEEDNGWLELCKIKMFETEASISIFAIGIEGNFVVKANVNLALGANLEYEIGKRYINWFSIFGNGSGSEQLDLVDERFAFQFYAMGHVGLKAGVLIEIKVGIISTKIGNVGVSAEVGAFVDIYGYFQYTYTKMRPAGGTEWEEEESLMGALYFEFGIYVEINVKAELLSLLEKSWEVYSGKWTLLTAGAQNNIYGFATELEDGEKLVIVDDDSNSTNGIYDDIPETYRTMKTMDMLSGETDTPVKPWISYYGYNFWDGDAFSLTQHTDKVNFTYTLTSEHFSLEPVIEELDGKEYIVDYKIKVDVPEGVHYMTCDLRLVWCMDKLCWSKYDMALTIPLVWTDLQGEELIEYRTATVKAGNETEGYRTVWSERFLKGEVFNLPTTEKILKLADYAGENDIRYSGYTGYTGNNRGETVDPEQDQSMAFDTVYYFELTTREYEITVKDVQNADGSTKDMTFCTRYGEAFDFSALNNTGTAKAEQYTAYYGMEARDSSGAVSLTNPTGVVKGNFATELLQSENTYHAKYANNGGTVTYKFTGISLDPITKVYKKGQMPSTDDFMSAIKAVDGTASVESITPAISAVSGDVVYSVAVVVPEKPLQNYTITYETNGGSAIAPVSVQERSPMVQPQQPTRAGYTFAGWYYDRELWTPVTWNRTMPSMDFTVYAKWTANNYTVTFNAGEGSTNATTLPVTYDKAVGTLPQATRPNYIFLGWYTAVSGGTQYTAETVYNTEGDITLYAHWKIKATIASGNVTVESQTTTYDGNGVNLAMSNDLGLDMSSFTISYKRQNLDRSWSTALPVNAGAYDVRFQREEDDAYLACEHTYTGKLVINKAARTISNSGLTATVVGGNLSVTSVPSYPGGGAQMFALGDGAFGVSGGFTNLDGTYQVKFYVAESENYLASNTVSTGDITVGTPYQPIDMKPTYKVTSYTREKLTSGTEKTVKVWLIHTDGSESAKTTLTASDIDKKGDTCTVTLYPTYDDPWRLYRIKYVISGSDAWDCSGYSLCATVNGLDKTVKSEGGANADRLFQLDNSASHYRELGSLKRNITGVGDFGETVNLSLANGDGLYTYTYDGTVVDQYAAWGTSGSGYNAFYHTDAPTLTLSCSESTVNEIDYAQYFRSNLNTVTIDRAGLYKAMVRGGMTSISATATLTFNTNSTESGNTWTKTFNISLPEAASISEGSETYYAPTDGDVTIQTEENKDYVYVTLGLKSNPGIWGMKNSVAFAADKLELLDVAEGSLAAQYQIKRYLNGGRFTFLAYRDSEKESYATGDFVTLTFKKKAETVNLETDLTLTTDQTIDDNGQTVEVEGIFGVGDFTSAPPSDENVYDATGESIVSTLKNVLETRDAGQQTFYYMTDTLVTEATLSGWFHTAKQQLGRYDQFGAEHYSATATKYTKDGMYYYTINYRVEYYLTVAQEAELDGKIAQILTSLALDGKTELEKLSAVYAYVCENVVYDEEAENCFTAYGALLDGKAVCQGYALAMLRLLGKAGVEADVVLGKTGEINHMWNVVKVDEEYFLLDATWDSDSEAVCYSYFLKGSDDFANHTPTEDYNVTLSKDDHEDAYVLSHSFAAQWSYDETHHWYACANCAAVNAKAAHTDENKDHLCDGLCDQPIGEHKDENKDHICDYGCNKALVAPTYTVTIPATVQAGEELKISADGIILYDTETLTVTVRSDFLLKNEQNATLPYTLGNLTDGAVALAVTGNGGSAPVSVTATYAVTVTEAAKYSGIYTGTVTFTIAVNIDEDTE